MIEFFFYFVSFSIVIVLLLFLSALWPPDSPWSPSWRTNANMAQRIINFANPKKSDILYDLGSGDGRYLIYIARKVGLKCVGIEIDPLRFFISVIFLKMSGNSQNVILKRADFKKINLGPATLIYAYLVPKALKRISDKIIKECTHGTRIITYRYKIPSGHSMRITLVKEDKKNKLYLYRLD